MALSGASGEFDPTQMLARIADYYTQKVRAYGCTPLGVDWVCQATQEMRFVQLLKLCDFSAPFSINDLGCGYGALAAFLYRRHAGCAIDYLGIDLSGEMVRRARRRRRMLDGARFVRSSTSSRTADYSVASGIFNVQLDASDEDWDVFIKATLQQLAAVSRRGFAVNFVTSPAPGQRVTHGLYTTPPGRWMEYCANNIGADVQLIDGYGMREFSLLVRSGAAAT
jgi:SAM-dependent methyltransferase